jgi:hypothetical protein
MPAQRSSTMGNRKRDVYPTKYFTATDFPETPLVLQIETARLEKFENDGKEVEKLVVYFRGQKSGLIVGPTVWDQIADVVADDGVSKFDSDDYTKWKDHWVELFRDKTPFGKKIVDCIRVRKPNAIPKKSKKSPPKSGKPDFNDEVPYR